MLSANETEETGGNNQASLNINHGASTSNSSIKNKNNSKEMPVPSTPTYQPTNIKTNAKFINNLSCAIAGSSTGAGSSGAAVASASPKPRVTNNHTNNSNKGLTDAAECVMAVERDEKLI